MPGRDWNKKEVEHTVSDYFNMLLAELRGSAYTKATHNARLRGRLDRRSKASVEFKHQNISAILAELGLPHITGYKPASNYQQLLRDEVLRQLQSNPQIFVAIAESGRFRVRGLPPVPRDHVTELFEDPPSHIPTPAGTSRPWDDRTTHITDYVLQEARNAQLGRLGEEFVMRVEKRRLVMHGLKSLAARVEWISQTRGDGKGFDILSYHEKTKEELFIEVKTTVLGKQFPFFVTDTEVRCSEDVPEKFRLYRVFSFAQSPALYVLSGSLQRACRLQPIQYRATI